MWSALDGRIILAGGRGLTGLTLRQLIGVAYSAFAEAVGREKAEEALAEQAAAHEPSRRLPPTAAEQAARARLLGVTGG